MAELLTPRSPARRVVPLELYSALCLLPRSINGYRRHTAGRQPCDGLASCPGGGGVAIPLGMRHVKETGISSGRLGLWLVCAVTFLYSDKCFSLIL